MGIKTFTITQVKLSISKHCRLDQKYCAFTNINDWVVFDSEFERDVAVLKMRGEGLLALYRPEVQRIEFSSVYNIEGEMF